MNWTDEQIREKANDALWGRLRGSMPRWDSNDAFRSGYGEGFRAALAAVSAGPEPEPCGAIYVGGDRLERTCWRVPQHQGDHDGPATYWAATHDVVLRGDAISVPRKVMWLG